MAGPLESALLSPKQVDSICDSVARINIWAGAVRSGKTIASLLRWLEFVARAPRGGQLIISGKTTDTVARNVLGPLMDPAITGAWAKQVIYTRGAPTAKIFGRIIEIITANDARAEGRLRGMTAVGAYVDELTLIPEEFFKQLLARLSVKGAKLFATTNPDGPGHWVRKQFLLRENELNLKAWHFTLDDNPALDPEYVTSLKAEYTGLWYRRFVLGQWCLAEGAVYDMWDEDRHVVSELPRIDHYISLGVDYGTTNPFAALMLGLGEDGRLYFTREYRYESKKQMRTLTDAEYAERLINWMDARGHLRPTHVVVDPSAASFRAELRDRGLVSRLGDNEILPGVRNISSLLATDRLRVHESCAGWREEIPGYSWDEEAALKGKDEPVDVDNHSLDAGRYGLHTTQPLWKFSLREPLLAAA